MEGLDAVIDDEIAAQIGEAVLAGDREKVDELEKRRDESRRESERLRLAADAQARRDEAELKAERQWDCDVCAASEGDRDVVYGLAVEHH